MDRLEHASAPIHYIKLVIAIVIVIVGVYLRFADFRYSSEIANVIFIIGALWIFNIVFKIIK